jgi:hypothetical protein
MLMLERNTSRGLTDARVVGHRAVLHNVRQCVATDLCTPYTAVQVGTFCFAVAEVEAWCPRCVHKGCALLWPAHPGPVAISARLLTAHPDNTVWPVLS